jgi:hypothetical protein
MQGVDRGAASQTRLAPTRAMGYDSGARHFADSINQGAPIAARLVLLAIDKRLDLSLRDGPRLTVDLSTLIARPADAWEGPRAVAQKRPPAWQGK